MKIAILTGPGSAAGYRLGGVEVVTACDEAEAAEILTRLIQTDEYVLIITNQRLLPDPYLAVKRVMRKRSLPVLTAVPPHHEAIRSAEDAAESYMRRLIKETTGYEFKL